MHSGWHSGLLWPRVHDVPHVTALSPPEAEAHLEHRPFSRAPNLEPATITDRRQRKDFSATHLDVDIKHKVILPAVVHLVCKQGRGLSRRLASAHSSGPELRLRVVCGSIPSTLLQAATPFYAQAGPHLSQSNDSPGAIWVLCPLILCAIPHLFDAARTSCRPRPRLGLLLAHHLPNLLPLQPRQATKMRVCQAHACGLVRL